ncbi:hypothetical protein [Oerskovia sp. Root22]|uniref:hypothetical protein n=1 Tax=Oerskovia sp. Root22 TaxID=1736494 RepID=UPI0006FA92C6|nr:hypothetical protein [Oerskovia sp. Root22]KRC34184.1 hypothetical protein ASE15_13475 [Oerskovia sp. Root22]
MRRLLATVSAARRRLPGPVNAVLTWLQLRLPLRIGERLDENYFGYTAADRPAPVAAPVTSTRLFIGPANYAGQGRQWARAVEGRLPDVGAVSMASVEPGGFSFPVDVPVKSIVYTASRTWQRSLRRSLDGFTHVILEAERPLAPRLSKGSVLDEARLLRARGLQVAMLCHGSDIRSPSRHAESEPWSPFRDQGWADVPVLEKMTRANKEVLDALGLPVFVSTPDLLLDVPGATWCPVVVDPGAWRSMDEPLHRARPLVVHAPSRAVIKGTALIEPVLQSLHEEGVIEYQVVEGVPATEMPDLYRGADVVLDQFRIGTYGVAACEAMAAGRLVVSHVDDQVRARASEARGMALPIIQATPDSLRDVLTDVVARREHFRSIAALGPTFVEDLHDGAASARALAGFLGRA